MSGDLGGRTIAVPAADGPGRGGRRRRQLVTSRKPRRPAGLPPKAIVERFAAG
jgi:hypothetical protein